MVFRLSEGLVDRPVQVPCGQCIGCKLEKSRQWAMRMTHEAQLHERNCFITLTYHDDYLPPDLSLDVTHWQKFAKRLRKAIEPAKIKFYHCGEYGEIFQRPHYHACIFGHDFEDKVPWKKNRNGDMLYQSASLSLLWPSGYSSVGSLTFHSAGYCARYVTKKVTGPKAEEHYNGRKPEYSTMSNGIGTGWFHKFHEDCYPHDYVVFNGKKMQPPKFYDGLYELHSPKELARLKGARKSQARLNRDNNCSRRLRVREEVKEAQTQTLQRKLEE